MSFAEYFERFINLNLNEYPNIGINLEINKLMLCLLIGLVVSTVLVSYFRMGMVDLVRSLLRREARSEESARTLDELRLSSLAVKYAVTVNSRIQKIVKRVGAPEYTYEEYRELMKKKGFKEERVDLKTAKFYIPESSSDEAKRIYEKNEISLINTVLFCVLLLVIFVCVALAMPEILTFIDIALA
jgi:cell division protein FtsL